MQRAKGTRLAWGSFFLLLALVTLLNIIFTQLRAQRSALAVADVGGSALSVPVYELFGALPAALALAWLVARLQRRVGPLALYGLAVGAFAVFFLYFAFVVYPWWRGAAAAPSLVTQLPVMLFFAVAEMWKVVVITLLLFGYLNTSLAYDSALMGYSPLMLGASLGALLTPWVNGAAEGLLTGLLTGWALDHWHAALAAQLSAQAALALLSLPLFGLLVRLLPPSDDGSGGGASPLMREALGVTFGTPHLSGLALIVFADYICYTLFEVVFLDLVKRHYPDPAAYNDLMALLAQWGGLLTAVTALALGPLLFKRWPWRYAALLTPVGVLAITALFFCALLGGEPTVALLAGCGLYIFGRAAKYGVADPAKELAFMALDHHRQRCGKLVVDGLMSRVGRGASAFIVVPLAALGGGAPLAAAVLFALFGGLWLHSTLVVASSHETLLGGGAANSTAAIANEMPS